jgi:hypothetical protein
MHKESPSRPEVVRERGDQEEERGLMSPELTADQGAGGSGIRMTSLRT